MQQQIEKLNDFLEIVYRRKWTVIIPAIALTALGAFIGFNMPVYYRSTTMILVEKQQVPETYVTPTDRTPFSQRLGTITQQIISRQNLEGIINDFRLYQENIYGGPITIVMKKLGLKKNENLSKEEVLEKMTSDISVNVIGDRRAGDAFSISYTGTSPEVAMEVTNKLASLFIEENLKARELYAEGTSDFLSNELDNAKKELESQERAVRSFKERFMGSLPQQLEANLRTLDRLESEMQALNVSLKNAEDRKSMLEGQLAQGAGSAAPGAPVNPVADELKRLQGELASLLSVYKENYPDVVITKKRINELKEILAKQQENSGGAELQELRGEAPNQELLSNLMSVKSQIEMFKKRQVEISRQIKIYEARVEETPASEQRYSDLRRDYDISIRNYQALLEKKLSAKLAENLEKRQKGERFKVIDPANLPERPFKQMKLQFTIAGAAAGIGLGFGVIFLLEFMNPAFRRAEEFENLVNFPVLAVIPAFPEGKNSDQAKKFRLINGRKS